MSTQMHFSRVFSLDGDHWRLAIDAANVGRQERWFEGPRSNARPTKVPWVIQDQFPEYHGVAWYWRDFDVPANPHAEGVYLLRFRAVDYLTQVWVNSVLIGEHEGAEEPFVLDATAPIKPGRVNRLAVRVLCPTYEPIDGISLNEVPEGRRDYPVPYDNACHTGGIIDSVDLLLAPALRITDLHVIPDWKSGDIQVRISVRNSRLGATRGAMELTVAAAVNGDCAAAIREQREFPPGDSLVELSLHVPNRQAWELNNPHLYRVTARVQAAGSPSTDERSVRCGFRDFQFRGGYFRLNGRRLRLHGGLYTVLQYPVSQSVPHDEDLPRRDVLNMKALGYNIVRITCGAAMPARQLDACDELGLLVCEEHFGASAHDPRGKVPVKPIPDNRWDNSLTGVIRRDRNHPSVVIWSLLNEVKDGPLFRHVVGSLGMIRDLDATRMVLLNSGRHDGDSSIGSWSSPHSRAWEKIDLRDVHWYPTFPHSAQSVRDMRGLPREPTPEEEAQPPEQRLTFDPRPTLLSEYGVCGAQDFARYMRHFEQLGKEHAPDARLYRQLLDQFLADWRKWRLDECWARPEDYFRDSQRFQAALALDDFNTWMANPALVGAMSSLQIVDAWFHGCGVTNTFRELKPGMAEAYTDLAAPVRLCLFVEPVNLYRGSRVQLEAVLVNLDVLRPGSYPLRLEVIGPHTSRIYQKTISVEVPSPQDRPEPPFARPVFSEDVTIDGPAGRYRFLATFERGAAAGGGETTFYLGDRDDMPPVTGDVTLWGDDPELGRWLSQAGIRWRAFEKGQPPERQVILACGEPPAPG
ncbi:MAG TPA: glycoside hydrolase family 2 TIM barrel-domain containing protein, partial [Phycisphaerae bacterium]|nr:glycoside hydrolase family 2 TIM barrel-domain containing protein [Phycisphaerae bacterium]